MTKRVLRRIRVDRMKANIKALRQWLSPSCKICAVVKANAYGMGARGLVPHFSAIGVDFFGVYSIGEAFEIAELQLPTPILMLMPILDNERWERMLPLLLQRQSVHITLHSSEQLAAVERFAQRNNVVLQVHIEVDTGMSRGGTSLANFKRMVHQALENKYLELAGIATHCAAADGDSEFTERQASQFKLALREVAEDLPPNTIRHFASTHAMLRSSAYDFDMVRLGLGVYGYGVSEYVPDGRDTPRVEMPIKPILSIISHIVHLQDFPAGASVGYGRTFVTDRATRLALVPIGYGLGYPRSLSNRSTLKINGKFAPIRGRVNMDQLIVDVTDIPEVHLGTEVQVISDDSSDLNAVEKLSVLADSNMHEFLCRFGLIPDTEYLGVEGYLT